MKAFLLAVVFCFIVVHLTTAQKQIVVEEIDITFEHGSSPGFLVAIPEVSFKKVQDSWVKSLEKGTKSKVQNEADEYSIFGALMKDISSAPINVYSYVKDNDTAILLAASFELKKDFYISTENDAERSAKTRAYLLAFAREHYLELAKEQLVNEEKKLTKLENDLKSLEKNKVKLEKMIQSNNVSVGSINDELVIQRTNLTSLNDELLTQTNQINAMEEGSAKDEKQKYITDLEKQIKKLNKDIESGEKKIIDMKAETDKAQNDEIPNNIKEQEQIRNDIEQQKEVVNSYKAKYNIINDYK
ncbi:MAG: hypothetical protein JXR41_13435 [Bacteroidales bacterium]|nr:hypothetical protein [Bacteroidales bacterium]